MHNDYVIVGAGISGCYLAYLLNKQYPKRRILILEKDQRYGGRLLSVPWDGMMAELGGWRFDPIRDFNVQRLVREFHLHANPIDLPRRDVLAPSLSPSPPGSGVIERITAALEGGINLHDVAFIPFLLSQGIAIEDILSFINYIGYDIYRGDIVAALARETDERLSHIREGYESLCACLLAATNDNVTLHLGARVDQIGESAMIVDGERMEIKGQRLIVTVPPQVLAQIYDLSSQVIESSLIPYNVIRLWCKIDRDIPVGTYVSISPIRKIYVMDERRIFIYVDGYYASVVQSLLSLVPTLIGANVIYSPSPIYHYWQPGIMFWRPKGRDRIYAMMEKLPFTYINGDVSELPGWVEGSLRMVNEKVSSLGQQNG